MEAEVEWARLKAKSKLLIVIKIGWVNYAPIKTLNKSEW